MKTNLQEIFKEYFSSERLNKLLKDDKMYDSFAGIISGKELKETIIKKYNNLPELDTLYERVTFFNHFHEVSIEKTSKKDRKELAWKKVSVVTFENIKDNDWHFYCDENKDLYTGSELLEEYSLYLERRFLNQIKDMIVFDEVERVNEDGEEAWVKIRKIML
jgi:hypothetical protein